MSTVVDSDARSSLAELVRHLGSGRITNDDFEDRRPIGSEPALHDVYFYGLWPLYDDFVKHRLVRNSVLTREGRVWVARIVLFLRSGEPYRYPRASRLVAFPVLLLSLATLGWFGRLWLRHQWRHGDQSVWPFYSREEYERALKNPVYLNGRAEPNHAMQRSVSGAQGARREREGILCAPGAQQRLAGGR